MARLTSANGIKVSGWSFIVGAEKDDFSDFTETELEDMRKGAPERMARAQAFYVAEIKKTLDRTLLQPSRNFSWLSGRHAHAAVKEPPGRITGELQRSWEAGRRRWSMQRTVLTGSVQSRHPAAGRLEFGDDPLERGIEKRDRRGRLRNIQPHPYIRPTLARIGDRLHDLVLGL